MRRTMAAIAVSVFLALAPAGTGSCFAQYVNLDPEPTGIRSMSAGGQAISCGNDLADAWLQPVCILGGPGFRATASGSVYYDISARDASFNELRHRWTDRTQWFAPGCAGAAYRFGRGPWEPTVGLVIHRMIDARREELSEGYRHDLYWQATTRLSVGIDATTAAFAVRICRTAAAGVAASLVFDGAERDYRLVYTGGEWRGTDRHYGFRAWDLTLGGRVAIRKVTAGLSLSLPYTLTEREEYTEEVSDPVYHHTLWKTRDTTLPARIMSIPAMVGVGLNVGLTRWLSVATTLSWKPYSVAEMHTTVGVTTTVGLVLRDTTFNCGWRDALLFGLGAECRPPRLGAPLRFGVRNIAGPYRNFDRPRSLVDSLSARGLAVSFGTSLGRPELTFDFGFEYARVEVEYLASHFPGQSVTDRLVDQRFRLQVACTYQPGMSRQGTIETDETIGQPENISIKPLPDP